MHELAYRSLDPVSPPTPHCRAERARELLRAVDAGGLPLNVAVVNHIARELGLDVSRKARMPETIDAPHPQSDEAARLKPCSDSDSTLLVVALLVLVGGVPLAPRAA